MVESEEVDECKVACADGSVLGQCGKFLLMAGVLAVICECESKEKNIYP